ncbi:MAG TPA: radical SAM protein [Patescibacteria group bacterium]|nr:radical SAM protein [Patescibacteria group bacterium]
MKVCLLIPPSPFLLDERVFPFIGILKLPPILALAGIPCEVLDLSGIGNYLDVVAEHALATDATHFGITSTTPQFPAAVKIAQTLKSTRPDARVIIGGTHATLTVAGVKVEKSKGRNSRAHHALEHLQRNFDVVVAGDGETTILSALEANAPWLIDADNRKSDLFLKNGAIELEEIFPDRSMIDLETYHYTIDNAKATSIIGQLGCPYKCGFCAGRNSPMLRNIRTRSSQSIVNEMLLIHEAYGISGIMFYDDELNVSPEMLKLMQLIAKTGRDKNIEWKLRGFIKSERFTLEQAEAMVEAGFKQILIGFESGSPRILENIQKIATQADNTKCMEIARSAGLKVKALMSLGHPGESENSINDTRKWLLDVNPFDFDATVITPYPGSPYFDEAVEHSNGVYVYTAKNGDQLYQEEVHYEMESDYYKGNPADGYVSHVWTPALPGPELVRLRNNLEADVREALNIPFNPSREAQVYEHSMGQSRLPNWILRS